MNDTQQIRASLPPGTVLRGTRHSYTVGQILCLSDRSVTAVCTDESGQAWRLKLFNGTSSVTEEIQKALLQISMKGVVLPADIGEYSGMRFAVSPVVNAKSADQFPVSIQLLRERIIPQTAYVVQQYHKHRILLRDICPEHILYQSDRQQIAYCGFQNAALLPGRATAVKTPGFGQPPGYLAPEVSRYGYSVCSDYFSLGAAILTMVCGKNPMESMPQEEFLKRLSSGQVPGIDIEHLRNTPYELYSAEDQVLYLVLGLMLPDPAKRWGYGEIRCFCNHQHIPLVPKGGKVFYQFSEPYLVGPNRCFNEQHLAETLAADNGAWKEGTVSELLGFVKRQCPKQVDAFSGYLTDQSTGPCGKLFRCIYTLYPSMDRLWWRGVSYPDMQTLVREAGKKASEQQVLRELLKERCLSFFCSVRAKQSAEYQDKIPELMQMEQWEIEDPGKGISRCMMRFADQVQSRSFQVEGRRYDNVRALLLYYEKDGRKLKQLSASILLSHAFQAWIWANGSERAGAYAEQAARQHPDQSFYLLLSLCESQAKEEDTKALARRLFLRFGDFAPVVWLADHIRDYRTTSVSHQMLYDTFEQAKFPVDDTLEVLAGRAGKLLVDYQTFVSRTLNNPFFLEHGSVDSFLYGYYPVCEDGYFCCTWEHGLEVSPAFLKTVQEQPNAKEISGWLSNAGAKEQKRLQSLLAEYPIELAPSEVLKKSKYRKILLRNLLYGILAFLVGAWLMSMGLLRIGGVVVLPAVLFLAGSVLWYQQKKEWIDRWNRRQSRMQKKRGEINGMIQLTGTRQGELLTSMCSSTSAACRIPAEQGQGVMKE